MNNSINIAYNEIQFEWFFEQVYFLSALNKVNKRCKGLSGVKTFPCVELFSFTFERN